MWHFGSQGWVARPRATHPVFTWLWEEEIQVLHDLDLAIAQDRPSAGEYSCLGNNCCRRAEVVLERIRARRAPRSLRLQVFGRWPFYVPCVPMSCNMFGNWELQDLKCEFLQNFMET